MLMHKPFKRIIHQCGVGLIEVMVAVLVLTIGILGIVALQTKALQFSQESVSKSKAMMLAYEMVDRMRANPDSVASYLVDYGTAVAAGANCETSTCSPTQMATYDKALWKAAIAADLPLGDGQVVVDNTGARPFYTISVRFTDGKLDRALDGGTGGDATKEVHVRTEI